MNEDNDIYVVCGRCMVKISGPTREVINTAFRGHEKEAHGYMTGQEFYDRLEKIIETIPGNDLVPKHMLFEAARKAAGLEVSND